MFDRSQFAPALASLFSGKVRAVVATAGGGSAILSEMERISGTSRFLIGGRLNNDYALTDRWIGTKPERYCTEEVAARMATVAWVDAQRYNFDNQRENSLPFLPEPLGFGMTVAIASQSRLNSRGGDRAWLAIRNKYGISTVFVELRRRSSAPEDIDEVRQEQLDTLTVVGINFLLQGAGLGQVPVDLTNSLVWEGRRNNIVASCRCPNPECGQEIDPNYFEPVMLKMEDINSLPWFEDNQAKEDIFGKHQDYRGYVAHMVTGNPATFGHIEQLWNVARDTGRKGFFWINQNHPTKGKVPDAEYRKRLAQFSFIAPVLNANHGYLYVDVARRYPGIGLVAGMDAIDKLLDPVYYGGDVASVPAMLDSILRTGSKLFVVGREVEFEGGKPFVSPDEMRIFFQRKRQIDLSPWIGAQMFVPMLGRWDVSSTELRKLSLKK